MIDMLSDRERQVFLLVGEGLNSGMIAVRLAVKRKTVDTHRSRIKRKLGFDTMPELIRAATIWAEREGASPPIS
jgi:DNA-binding CsgD family transcriptional regulator